MKEEIKKKFTKHDIEKEKDQEIRKEKLKAQDEILKGLKNNNLGPAQGAPMKNELH